MKYPLTLSFKLLALGSRIYVRDADGALIGYVKQKLLKLKEEINVYADEEQKIHLYTIKADRVLDFSAKYNFTDSRGNQIGAIKRRGMRSIWKANYEIFDQSDDSNLQISEENAWVKVFDSLVGEIPIVGMFAGYVFNPAYLVARPDGTTIARLAKQPAMFEGKFVLEKMTNLSEEEEVRVLLSVLTMTLAERARG